jgi:hypothetical protein
VNVPATFPTPETGEKLAPSGRPVAFIATISLSASEALTTKLCVPAALIIIDEGTLKKGGWFATGGGVAETRIVAREKIPCGTLLLSTVCRVTT